MKATKSNGESAQFDLKELSPECQKRLKAASRKTGKSMGYLIESCLREHLAATRNSDHYVGAFGPAAEGVIADYQERHGCSRRHAIEGLLLPSAVLTPAELRYCRLEGVDPGDYLDRLAR
jgi:hypothetical protein